MGYERLRLIIVVIRDEVLDPVFREELFELPIQLSGKGFVMAEYQCRTVHLGKDISDGESLSGARHAEQGLELLAFHQAPLQLLNSLRLVARRLKFRVEFIIHNQ